MKFVKYYSKIRSLSSLNRGVSEQNIKRKLLRTSLLNIALCERFHLISFVIRYANVARQASNWSPCNLFGDELAGFDIADDRGVRNDVFTYHTYVSVSLSLIDNT